MNRISRKNYAAIYVPSETDIQKVKDIIKEIDAYEYDYLPKDLIKLFSDYPAVAYTHKFCDMDMDKLTAICWSIGIYVWVYDAREEFPVDVDI